MSFAEWDVCTFRDLDLLSEQWRLRQDRETERFKGLAVYSVSPYMEADARPSLADCFPRFAPEPEPEDSEEDEQIAALMLDCMWVDLKTRSKLN